MKSNERKCTTCGSLFEKTKTDTMRICKPCNNTRIKGSSVEYKMYNRAQQRCKTRGGVFEIEMKDIPRVSHCPVFGFKLEQYKGKSGGRPTSPSLDRIDNTKGYVKGNLQVISHQANQMKSSASPEELIMFANWILKTYTAED